MTTPFPCTACGQCCRHVHLSQKTAYLDRGDGVCRHLDDDSDLCTIYENRPLICQIENYYHQHYAHLYDWDDFVTLNLDICQALQNAKPAP